MTSISTHNYVRTDVPGFPAPAAPAVRPSRGWALAGVGAALTAIVGTVAAGTVGAVYDPEIAGGGPAILEALGDTVPQLTAFHVAVSLSALLMPVFALGLYRRLRSRLEPGSLLPGLAAFGLLGTAVVLVMGGALNTEFIFAVANPESVLPESSALYNHWIGTVPGCWILTGLSGVAVFAASRKGAVTRWIGVTGLLLGGLSGYLLKGSAPPR